jgi:hypothetical protein
MVAILEECRVGSGVRADAVVLRRTARLSSAIPTFLD